MKVKLEINCVSSLIAPCRLMVLDTNQVVETRFVARNKLSLPLF